MEPTAIDVEEKDDAIAQKIAQEEAQAQAALEKRAALVALHDMYDVEIEKLGQTELKLLAERLTSLRSAALRDIPVRFDLAVKNYKVDCDKWVGRLEKCTSDVYTIKARANTDLAAEQTMTKLRKIDELQWRTRSPTAFLSPARLAPS